jgi:hypothetical protein
MGKTISSTNIGMEEIVKFCSSLFASQYCRNLYLPLREKKDKKRGKSVTSIILMFKIPFRCSVPGNQVFIQGVA